MSSERAHVRGMEFVHRVKDLLPLAYEVLNATFGWEDPRYLSSTFAPDIVAGLSDDSVLLVEVRNYGTGTSYRIDELVGSLSRLVTDYGARFPQGGTPTPLLVISGTLSAIQYAKLQQAQIALIDGPALAILERRCIGLPDKVRQPHGRARTPFDIREQSRQLTRQLSLISPGRQQWLAYQRLCGDIMQFAFCPPLEVPIFELSTKSGANRRDYILPNYASGGFWKFVRVNYGADHVVVDAKNNAVLLKKDSVLQMANYLNEWGCGRFGILSTRNGVSRTGIETIREQWIMHRKMILVLDDGDIAQILELKAASDTAEDLIRQKIEDFRLSF